MATNASQTRFAYVAEAEAGTTPVNPQFKTFPIVSDTLNADPADVRSEGLRPDRQVVDAKLVAQSAAGGLETEMAAENNDDFFEGLFNNSWVADGNDASISTLVPGNNQKTFTFEKTFNADPDIFQRIRGGVVDTLDLTLENDAIIRATWGIQGFGAEVSNGALGGSAYTASGAGLPWDSSNNLFGLEWGGVALGTATALSMNITNNGRQQQVLGSVDSIGIGTGLFEVSGTISVYLNDAAQMIDFQTQQRKAMSFRLADTESVDNSRYIKFDMTYVKFVSADIGVGGNNTDVIATFNFGALSNNEATGSTITLTRHTV